MSVETSKNCPSSASDCNLADLEDRNSASQTENRTDELGNLINDIDRQVFFTLPRWMSGRRKSRRKIKDIKVDVPYKARDEPSVRPQQLTLPRPKKKTENAIQIFAKLFKKNSACVPLTNGPTQPHTAVHEASSISASNTDIRAHVVVADFPDVQEHFKGKLPAICGIKNHGNTCFMNAIIQCLSNTDFFAEYFVMDQYKLDFMRRNKIHAKKYGTKGEVTEQLGTLMKSLWSCQYYPDISYKFKHLVAKYGSQYEGTNQHDAQEFFLWLLDKVHEDLNTAPKQKYKKPKSTYGRPDEDLAAETLANHLRCNNSFIHDLFQGQFRSSLSCPGCGRYSNTFDPYLCVSLPVPHCQTIAIFVHLVLLGKNTVLKIGLSVDLQNTVKSVRSKISASYSVPEDKIILTEFTECEFRQTFSDNDLVGVLKDIQNLYAIELPAIKPSNNNEGEQLVLVIVNRVLSEEQKCETFWQPFVLHITREATFKTIQEKVLDQMRPVLKIDPDRDSTLFQIRVIDGIPEHELLPDSVDLPLYMPVIDQALTLCDSVFNRGPQHLKIAAEWTAENKEKYVEEKQFLEDDLSALFFKNSEPKSSKATLYECFDTYFKEEKLGVEDAWMCPFCHRRLQGVKQLSLWSVPDVFVVHLKRFRQTYCQRTKVTTMVEFPLTGLDMNKYIAVRNTEVQQNHHSANGSVHQMAMWSPWRRPRSRLFPRSEENVYDLFAVCSHHGSMQGGHYTAYCKNPVEGHWYLYDDDRVQKVEDHEVMTANGYILFYQRSSLALHSCASSSTSTSGYSSTSSASFVTSEHWAFRMPPFLHIVPKTSKSQDNLSNMLVGSATLDNRRSTTLENRPFTRAARSYSSMIQFSDCKSPLVPEREVNLDDVPPPPPPPVKRYWTITSV